MYSKADIFSWLEAVKDPEIPTVSLVDLGVIRAVEVEDSGRVVVRMTPTFAGCPAMDYMRRDVEQTLRAHGVPEVQVEISLAEAWSSDMVTEKGRAGLRQHGLTPPPMLEGQVLDLDFLEYAECPRCHGHNTELRTPFGATLCRAVHYCHDCRQIFEQFKPL
ncbi:MULTISPECIES: 1,2-phenylacetyl-CoA epoxidase subunit PaaD [Hymenobacter]|uniref:Phenylacetate-CoA oxygenase subunit PaaJ n=1 Tax=Hymenobacter jejuensis TaxID=2502781 RepID=A0A5B8A2M1_9BACT|nr:MULTISPECIES: 1,2-phenylacetyl-CoA epoxidase subunit PaaD [Hymenobacter]MBC6989375.1 phenylacetate-CoA oxygenase subunit PaaJ [Hymenobacter sp. BT491]QDA61407.1 phenylacetate-CoA oxygenase subunit PaaJ [Hymenobacter jejuensis]